MADPNSLFDPATPIADQIGSNPVGTSMLWGVDPTTLRPYANAGVTPGLNADSLLKLPMANVAMGFGDNPGTMAGVGAKTADLMALKAAQKMAGRGVESDAIWKNTGWMQGADGQWRFEIPDNTAQIGGKDYTGGQLTLGHVMDHPELFKAYPELANMPVHGMPSDLKAQGYRGAYDPSANAMWITGGRAPSETLSTVLHEGQHAVQTREGFQNGGNLNEGTIREADNLPVYRDQVQSMDMQMRAKGLDPNLIRQAIAAGDGAAQEAMTQMGQYLGPQFATGYREGLSRLGNANQAAEFYRNNYSNMAGEVEARTTQARQSLTPAQRRAMPPDWTQDVPTEQQIVTGPDGNTYKLTPAQGIP